MLDDKSEIIAHFIGIFELNVEAARMKIQYQEMQAWLSPDPDLGPLLNVTINVTSPYELKDFEPDLGWRTVSPPPPSLFVNPAFPPTPAYEAPYYYDFFPKLFFNMPPINPGFVLGGEPIFFIPYPSSLATVSVQTNWLQDHDILLNYDAGVSFLPAASFDTVLTEMALQGQSLHVLSTPEMPEDEAAIATSAEDLHKKLTSLEEDGLPAPAVAATVYVAHDDDALSITVNGETAESLPELPEVSNFFAIEEPQEDEEELTDGAKEATGEEITQDLDGTPLGDDEDGAPHELITGGNVLLNEARIASDWLDAPVISVMGKVSVTNAVSQVNIWNDTDFINGAMTKTSGGTTNTFSGFEFEQIANPKPQAVPEEGETLGSPKYVVISELDGNLINYSYVKQFNFASDNDVVSVRFDAHETFFQTGGNFLANAHSLLGLGFHYDLIVVGGDMIDMKYISQTNVMLDSDVIYHQDGFAGSIESSDNLLFNWAKIRDIGSDQATAMTQSFAEASDAVARGDTDIGSARNDDAFAGSELLRVLYIKGSILDVQVVEQINVLGDADQIAWASETVQSADGADISVISGQNETINLATITDSGIDSTIYTSEGAYTESFLYQADFISEEDPLLAAETSGLTGEAFLFLADGLIAQDDGTEDGTIAAPLPEEGTVDVMQSVLA